MSTDVNYSIIIKAALQAAFPDCEFTIKPAGNLALKWVDGPDSAMVGQALHDAMGAEIAKGGRLVLDGRAVALVRIVNVALVAAQ